MTSIHTNAGAISALQTLRSINTSMERTQAQISSGLRVSTASDNAAYWSISTTMRSDEKAMSAVSDALGFGAAKADIAYTGLDATIELLTAFRSRLVVANEPGIDSDKIQIELQQFKQQLVSIASSSSFNGVNWLKSDQPQDLAEISSLTTSIVSDFTRSSNGDVKVGETTIDLAALSLFNTGGGGALQKDIRSLGSIGGFRYADANESGYTGDHFHFTGPVTFSASDQISFDLLVDDSPLAAGNTYAVTIDKSVVDAALFRTDGKINNVDEFNRVLRQALIPNGIPASSTFGWNNGTQSFVVFSREISGLPGSSIGISGVFSTFPGNFAMGLEDPSFSERDNIYPQWSFNFTGQFRIYRDVAFSFDLAVSGGPTERLTVDRDMVDTVLGTTDGMVSDASDMVAILSHVLDGKGLIVGASGSMIQFEIDKDIYPNAGNRASLHLGNVGDNLGPRPDFDILDVDITTPNADLDNYLFGVDAMLNKVTAAASDLGALQKAIANKTSFLDTLRNTITEGIGRLVDADMNEAATWLRALETQQQLASQALTIANGNTENIMRLFE